MMNNKKKSVLMLVVMAALTIILGFTAIVGWGSKKTGAMSNIKTGLDLSGGVSITYEATESNPSQQDMDDTIYKLQQRVTQYSTEAKVYQQGLNRINVEIPGVKDANAILEELGTPGSLTFQDEDGNTVLEGSDIADAEGVATQNQTSGQREYVVELTMTSEGAEKFQEATAANVGKQISIVYDGEVISSPTVQEEISGGKAQIDGMSSLEEAQTLASYIRIGSLTLELNEVYSNVVGASLGQEALKTSVIAGLIGILIVIAFMIWAYRISGVASGWALLDFVFIDLIAINAFDVTLTLPGIAGVILSIGMAVDANVIIYARSREELTAGRSVREALKAGFHKAFSAIFDGQITTLMAAIVLYILGTGTIQGFAITLAMGTVFSMFTALVLSRWISYAMYGVGARNEKLYGKIRQRKPINFVGKKAIFFTIAIVLLVSAPIGMVYHNSKDGNVLNYSLDFVGGTATTVDFGTDMSLEDLDEKVEPVVSEVTGNHDIQFQKVENSTQVIIKTTELDLDKRDELNKALEDNFNVDADSIEAENISSVISGEMRANAIKAVIVAVICMLLYIGLRFRDMRFASSAVLALCHDIGIVLVYYVWSRASVGSDFIAVMLTILGYSINSTIVIFDRIRENLRSMKGQSLRLIVNASITQTLTRSIYSTFTTFITIFVLYLMGVPSIREFALPIMVGLIAGMFSSVCITGPLWYVMKTHIGKNRVVDVPETPAVEGAAEGAAAGTAAAADAAATQGARTKKKPVDKTQYHSTKPKKASKKRR